MTTVLDGARLLCGAPTQAAEVKTAFSYEAMSSVSCSRSTRTWFFMLHVLLQAFGAASA
jgi:hypothetical protein